MSIEENQKSLPPRRKPLWPWVVLLILTLCAIYSYNRAAEIVQDVMQNMPSSVIELFNDLLDSDRDRPGSLRVEALPASTHSRIA